MVIASDRLPTNVARKLITFRTRYLVALDRRSDIHAEGRLKRAVHRPFSRRLQIHVSALTQERLQEIRTCLTPGTFSHQGVSYKSIRTYPL